MKNKKFRFSLSIISFTILLLTCVFCASCARFEWRQVYEAYTQGNTKLVFQSFKGTISDFDTYINEKDNSSRTVSFKILIDSDDYLERYKEDAKAEMTLSEYQTHCFYLVPESLNFLNESGFFDEITADTVITFTVNNYIGWDGWWYPVFGVEIADKTYLDFDTGYEYVVNYAKENMK